MTHTIGYYDHIEHDAVTAQSLIRQQRKLLEMQMSHINDLNRRLAESIRREAELRERIAELEAGQPQREPVPYAITRKTAEDYRIPRAGCQCGACCAARDRGEVEL